MICPVTDEDLAEVRARLEQYRATSLSLLSNLEDHGTSLTEELDSGDFEEWEPLMQAFATEEGMPLARTSDQPQKHFEAQAAKGYVWGLLSDKLLLSTADYNARSGATAQVGGVFTQPLYRRRGLSRAVIKSLIVDSVKRHSIDLLILLTRDHRGPRKLYKSFGFEQIGSCGLLSSGRECSLVRMGISRPQMVVSERASKPLRAPASYTIGKWSEESYGNRLHV